MELCVDSSCTGVYIVGKGCILTPSPRHLGRRPKGEQSGGQGRPAKETLTLAGLGQGLGPLFSFSFIPNGLLSLKICLFSEIMLY
jgi:hypothetical protein